ncbi:glycosyltransferase [uncultured Zobellia sp.]|uniref:glycosyltransferase n=1 Tax=uncultured Zobellia sp. TaxID=255433 RepID=UPI002593BDE4|nr:glycosyltransferase [uncultured Zobellia sp.]
MKQSVLLVIGFTWPEPASTAAGNRMLQLLLFFKSEGYKIIFTSAASRTELSLDLEELQIETKSIALNDSTFDAVLKEIDPNIVLFDRFLTEEQFGWRVSENVPQALKMLDTEDLHSLRKVRELAHKKGIPFAVKDWVKDDITKREVASILRCDLSLMVSSFEMELLTKTLRIDKSLLLHLPFLLELITPETQEVWPKFNERSNFVCIGNGKHAPNVDTVKWLYHDIWPLIRKALPEAQVAIYGAYMPQQITQLHKPDIGFYVKGWAEDAVTVLKQARINLAPLRFGAGIKGKLTTAMQSGTPSITTTIGAEGMREGLNWSGAIAETPQELAREAVRLYTSEKNWLEAQRNGVTLINELYNQEKLGERLAAALHTIQEKLEEHREQNFMGSLLQHQSMQSTKYLSKWIEEKNKKVL